MQRITALASLTSPFLALLLATPLAARPPVQEPGAQAPAAEELTQAELESLARGLQSQIEVLRGAKFTQPVAVALSDAASFRTYVTLRMQRLMPAERLAAEEDTYKLLGMLPGDLSYMQTMMAMLESQVGGFYDPGEDKFFLMKTFTGGLAKVILAHELTHALDDQRWDLDAGLLARMGNSDELFAFQSVVEGSGMAVMSRWMLTNGRSLSIEEIQKAGNMGMEGLADVPPALWKPLLAAYTRGAAFLANTESATQGQMAAPDPERIDAAFNAPPRSSEQVLHPAKYWDEGARDEPIDLRLMVGTLPEGVRLVAQDVLGEFGCTLFTEKPDSRKGLRSQLQAAQTVYTSKAGKGWGGDRLALLSKGKARAAVWWTTWDTTDDATEFLEASREVEGFVRDRLDAWATARELPTGARVQIAPAAELDATRAVRVITSIGFDDAELQALQAGLSISYAVEPEVPGDAPSVPPSR